MKKDQVSKMKKQDEKAKKIEGEKTNSMQNMDDKGVYVRRVRQGIK